MALPLPEMKKAEGACFGGKIRSNDQICITGQVTWLLCASCSPSESHNVDLLYRIVVRFNQDNMQGGIFPGIKHRTLRVAMALCEHVGRRGWILPQLFYLRISLLPTILHHLQSLFPGATGKWITAAKSIRSHKSLTVTGEWNPILGGSGWAVIRPRAGAKHMDAVSFSLICNGEWEEIRKISRVCCFIFLRWKPPMRKSSLSIKLCGEVFKNCYGT